MARGLLLILIGIVFLVLIPFGVTRLLVNAGIETFRVPFFTGAGALMIVLGCAALLYCTVLLHSVKGTPFFTETAVSVQNKGLYRYSRNPMYLSDMAITLGVLLVAGAPPALLLGGMLVEFVYFEYTVMRVEEPRLREKFGTEYEMYVQKVPRWFSIG